MYYLLTYLFIYPPTYKLDTFYAISNTSSWLLCDQATLIEKKFIFVVPIGQREKLWQELFFDLFQCSWDQK